MIREKRQFVERVLLPFTMRDIETVVNMYIWLTYNDLTLEDVRENLTYLRHAKERDKRNILHTSMNPSTLFEDMPYSFMKILQRTLRRVKRGDVSISNLLAIYKKERDRVLSQQSFGRQHCPSCKKKQEWPWEVLR